MTEQNSAEMENSGSSFLFLQVFSTILILLGTNICFWPHENRNTYSELRRSDSLEIQLTWLIKISKGPGIFNELSREIQQQEQIGISMDLFKFRSDRNRMCSRKSSQYKAHKTQWILRLATYDRNNIYSVLLFLLCDFLFRIVCAFWNSADNWLDAVRNKRTTVACEIWLIN